VLSNIALLPGIHHAEALTYVALKVLNPIFVWSSGRHLMASLCAYQASFLAEDLHASQGSNLCALRTSLAQKSNLWNLASSNVRTLLDADGPTQTARCCDDVAIADERKIDQIVNELGR